MAGAAILLLETFGCSTVANDVSSSSASSSTASSTSSTEVPVAGSSTASSATGSQTAAYTSGSAAIEVDSDTLTLTISGLSGGEKIYLAKTNPTATAVSKSYSRYITAGSGITLNTASSSSSGSSPSAPTGGTGGHTPFAPRDLTAADDEMSLSRWHCFIPQEFELDSTAVDARAAASSSVTQIDGAVGDTMRIYVDTDTSMNTYSAKAATLRAVGSYCYVWIIDSYYSETASGNKVNTTVAENIAAQFDAVYPMVRNVFGQESDYLLSSSGSASYAMASYSPTGEKVNIVLYDIANDYSENSVSSTGVAGYFYSKDYYYVGSRISNKGKYFYVDSAYANQDINDIYSTLAHEFQHMIHFGVKYIEQGLSSGTGYNEMLSMLCEDMMEAYFEDKLDGFDEDSSPMNRLPWFNELYYYSGLEYRSSSTVYALCSYASNYAFGAWLLRNYGGIPLLAEMSGNNSVDTTSIVAAVNEINGASLTMTDLLQAFARACIVDESGSGFNISVDNLSNGDGLYYSAGSYSYPLGAIDLWNLAELLPDTAASYTDSSYYKYDGPDLLASNEYIEVRPYGILLHDLGTATADTVTLTFSSATSSSLKMYVIIE